MKLFITTIVLAAGAATMAGAASAGMTEIQATADTSGTDSCAVTKPAPVSMAAHRSEVPAALRIIVHYFHGEFRCESCLRIEAWTESAIRTDFAQELADSTLRWSACSIDEPQNEHFIDDFKLTNRSVVLVELANGEQKRWKNLEAVWDLLNNEDAFKEYIRSETQAYLDGK